MMKKLLPDQSVLKALLKYNARTGRLYSRHTGKEVVSSMTDKGYRRGSLLGSNYMAHRIIWKWLYGTEPDEIDHRNGRKDDNRRANLREADRSINMRNCSISKRNTTGVVGVSPHRGKWRATIRRCGHQDHLGVFDTLLEAKAVRAAAALESGYSKTHGRPANETA